MFLVFTTNDSCTQVKTFFVLFIVATLDRSPAEFFSFTINFLLRMVTKKTK